MAAVRMLWVCLGVGACGGIAVIDGEGAGNGGAEPEPFRCSEGEPVSACGTPLCWCGHGSCGCELICNGVRLNTECEPLDATARRCDCSRNGELIASCDSAGGADCELASGCCADVFGR